jgi:two-component system, chemotaxis family, sensor kinase CheA
MPDRMEALRQRLFSTFRTEAEEHLQFIHAGLDDLARAPASAGAAEQIEGLFREMHTLKGAARSVGLEAFEAICHRCETVLSSVVQGGSSLDPEIVRTLQEDSDVLAGMLAAASPGGSAAAAPDAANTAETGSPANPAPGALASEAAPVSIRVEIDRLDRLGALAENLLSPKLAAAEHVLRARRIAEEIEQIRAGLTSSALREELRSIETSARALVTTLRGESSVLSAAVDDLYEEMRRVRMMPALGIFDAFPLMVRDLCRETGKEVDWELVGGQLEIDRKVLDLVKDPLIHLVRNAIDHGIEAPDAREAAGKPRRGRVSVTIAPVDGGRIAVEVLDDGRGFEIDAIRDAAVRAHVSSADQIAGMDDADVADLAYAAGVSTSPVITTISGHGRGLAIVRERLERVEGRISTRSASGHGTAIRLEFPSSIVTYRALLVAVDGTQFLLPLEAVQRVFAATPEQVEAALASGLLRNAREALPFGRLATILGLPVSARIDDGATSSPCVLVRSGDRQGVLLVDDVLGEYEVVVKDLRPPLRRVRNVLAAALLGTGDLVLVLRPLDVLMSIHARPAQVTNSSAVTAARVVNVLVADDSITTRTMERNLFEAAGYAVRVAADGLDAWSIVQAEQIDVVVSDVDMPRMNGFELTTQIRSDPKLSGLPIVLVTALETREDKERGLRVGANAYVLKSGFNQADLLDIVRRLT